MCRGIGMGGGKGKKTTEREKGKGTMRKERKKRNMQERAKEERRHRTCEMTFFIHSPILVARLGFEGWIFALIPTIITGRGTLKKANSIHRKNFHPLGNGPPDVPLWQPCG